VVVGGTGDAAPANADAGDGAPQSRICAPAP
jgi:hypothetical protein